GPRPEAWPAAATIAVTVTIALSGTLVTRSAIAPRYTSIVFGLWIVLAALGVHTVSSPRARTWLVLALVVLGLVASVNVDLQSRTEAPQVASALAQRLSPGDIVAYCPDQLGPAVSRLLSGAVAEYTFPRWSSPKLVDWVDYDTHVRNEDPTVFADELDAIAGRHDIWLVWSNTYVGTETACSAVPARLAAL